MIPKKILVVEDEQDVLRLTAYRLKKSGYEVLTAIDGQKALNLLQENIPDLIILDLLLPAIHGYEVCKRIKSDTKLKNIPVILFTASVLDVERKVKELGVDDFIMKPFELEILLEKVKKLIG
ncbi:MAG: response regulator [Candidatus Omnitrophota bacterium]|nr:response regulator [Candidatus Omnitrophota bacterium]